jgi:hypothetical protein
MSSYHLELINRIETYHCKASIVANYKGDYVLYEKRKGLLSGSAFTNLCGSWINCFMLVYFLLDHDITPTVDMIHVCGDDCLLGINDNFTIDYMASYFWKKFKIKISKHKSEIFKQNDNVYFLGGVINENGRYADFDLIKEQLCLSSNRSELDEGFRLFSKLCSSCFKYKDGHKLFFETLPYLRDYIDKKKVKKFTVPEYYFNFAHIHELSTEVKYLKVKDFCFNGWLIQ